MNLTKLCGAKIGKETIASLLTIIGENTRCLEAEGHVTTLSTNGKVRIIPTKKGLKIDLHIFRKDVYVQEVTQLDGIFKDERIPPTALLYIHKFHLNKTIPYLLLQ